MPDHPSHRMNAYKDLFKWCAFCMVCGKETDLDKECLGQYVSSFSKVSVDNQKQTD